MEGTKRTGLMLAAALLAAGCGGSGVQDTTCAEVERSTDKTNALIEQASEDIPRPPDDVAAGLQNFCSEAKPDDKPYPELRRYADAAFEAEMKEAEKLGLPTDAVVQEREKAIEAMKNAD